MTVYKYYKYRDFELTIEGDGKELPDTEEPIRALNSTSVKITAMKDGAFFASATRFGYTDKEGQIHSLGSPFTNLQRVMAKYDESGYARSA